MDRRRIDWPRFSRLLQAFFAAHVDSLPYGADGWTRGGCLLAALAIKKLLGRGAKLLAVHCSRSYGGYSHQCHVFVEYRGRYIDAGGVYTSPDPIVDDCRSFHDDDDFEYESDVGSFWPGHDIEDVDRTELIKLSRALEEWFR